MIQNEIRENLSACVPMRINQYVILDTWSLSSCNWCYLYSTSNNICAEKRRQTTGKLQIIYNSLEGLKTGEEKGLGKGLVNI